MALVERARSGDPFAARTLTARLSPIIHARVRRVLARGARATTGGGDATDLASEVWLALIDRGWRKLLAFDPERGASFEGYVGLLAEHEAINRLESERARKRGGRERHVDASKASELAAPHASPEEIALASDLASALERHLWSSLSERGRLILRYLYADGRTADEVASILNVERQVVYNWQHKIRQLAQSFLETSSAA